MTDTLDLTHWIDGERVAADRPGESLNPSDIRDVVARTPDGGQAEVDRAVAAAKAAFPAWAEAGVETFLTKPIDPRALTAALLAAAPSPARIATERAA